MLPCHPQVWFSPSDFVLCRFGKLSTFLGTAHISGMQPGADCRNRECNHPVTRIFNGTRSALSEWRVRGPCRRSLRTANTDREPGVIMQSLATVFDSLFGCHHSSLSRVFTIRRQTYRVCCDCGTAFKYSLETMSIERRLAQPDRERHGGQAMATCGLSRLVRASASLAPPELSNTV
jgi:hypothetical protein